MTNEVVDSMLKSVARCVMCKLDIKKAYQV